MNSESQVNQGEPKDTGRQLPVKVEADADGDSSVRSTNAPATVIVRGEVVREQAPADAPEKAQVSHKEKPTLKEQVLTKMADEDKEKMSATNAAKRDHLPALDDDKDVGVSKDQLVIRDREADLTFTGTLLASAAPKPPVENSWEEYRIYETTAGKHVFSKVTRSVWVKEPDRHEAEVFDPAPASMSSKLLREVRDLAHSRPMEWTDAAVKFFGYNPLSKVLYRKLGSQFDHHIS